MKSLKLYTLIAAFILSFAATAQAIPTLQLYMEGATYDSGTQSWVLANSGTFTLWVLGSGGVYDVKLAAAYATGETGSISLTPTTASFAPQDTTAPNAVTFNGLHADATIPVMGDGSDLPSHGIYGAGTSWMEWLLGDFTSTSEKIADLTQPTALKGDGTVDWANLTWKDGQLNAYNVTVTGFSTVHFDAYDHVVKNNEDLRYVFAPFSHDADTTPVPEPGTLVLLGAGLFGLAIYGKRRMNKQ